MPHHIGLKTFHGQNLALGVDGKQGDILVRSDIKTQKLGLILDRFNGGAGIRRSKHIGTLKPRFAFAVVLVLGPFLIKPNGQRGPGIRGIIGCGKEIVRCLFWIR